MKKITLLLLLAVFACQNTPEDNIEKIIKQKIISNGMGMIEIKELTDLEKVDEKTYIAKHSFFNEMVKRDTRVTNKYFINDELSKVDSLENIKTELFIEGDWIDSGW